MTHLWPICRIDDPTTGSPLPPPVPLPIGDHPLGVPRMSFFPAGDFAPKYRISKTNDYKGLAELDATNFFTEPLSGRGPRGSPRNGSAAPTPL